MFVYRLRGHEVEAAGTSACASMSSVIEPEVELDVPRLVGLGVAELAEGRAGQSGGHTSQKVTIGQVESRPAEFQGLLFAAEVEGLADCQVFVQLRGLA